MIIKKITIWPLRVNNYLVICEETNKAVLIDAWGDFDITTNLAKINNTQIIYVLNTHWHLDHIAWDYDLQKNLNVKIFLHKWDIIYLNKIEEQANFLWMYWYNCPKIDKYLEDWQEIKLWSLSFKVIHTPGHSEWSVCFLIGNILFSWDTIFKNTIWRTDLLWWSYNKIIDSITNKLFQLDDDIIVYPGHWKETTIWNEKNSKLNNLFIKLI